LDFVDRWLTTLVVGLDARKLAQSGGGWKSVKKGQCQDRQRKSYSS